jgi:hypothetical protein
MPLQDAFQLCFNEVSLLEQLLNARFVFLAPDAGGNGHRPQPNYSPRERRPPAESLGIGRPSPRQTDNRFMPSRKGGHAQTVAASGTARFNR